MKKLIFTLFMVSPMLVSAANKPMKCFLDLNQVASRGVLEMISGDTSRAQTFVVSYELATTPLASESPAGLIAELRKIRRNFSDSGLQTLEIRRATGSSQFLFKILGSATNLNTVVGSLNAKVTGFRQITAVEAPNFNYDRLMVVYQLTLPPYPRSKGIRATRTPQDYQDDMHPLGVLDQRRVAAGFLPSDVDQLGQWFDPITGLAVVVPAVTDEDGVPTPLKKNLIMVRRADRSAATHGMGTSPADAGLAAKMGF